MLLNKPISIGIFFLSVSIKSGLEKFHDMKDIAITLVDKSFENAIAAGKTLEEQGVEVIIGRRGTASILRENLKIPVLSFPTSTMGLLVSIQNASKKGKKIFLPSYQKPIQRLDLFQDFLDIEIGQGVYTDEASLNLIIKQAERNGFEVVIGGRATMQAALKTNLYYCELVTLENEIAETMESARSVAISARNECARTKEYRAIMDASSDAIIAVDKAGQVSAINRAARIMLNFSDDYLGRPVTTILPNPKISDAVRKKSPIVNKVIKLNDFGYLFNFIPIMIDTGHTGSLISLREINQVIKAESSVRRSLAKGFTTTYNISNIIYRSPEMSNVVNLTSQFAGTDSTVLITGSTGTGKELIAQSLHNLSARRAMPFVSVNCGALPVQLLESELFGYEEGAFTGSKKGGKPGFFEIAHDGTIFLDEIDSTNLNVQKRLLRVLQEKEIMRIGADKKVPVNVLVIVASSVDLWTLVKDNKFRKDLFFRLNVLQISIPPLKHRREDIPLLLDHFIQYYSKKHNILPFSIPFHHLNRLIAYEWPGNVRQLRYFTKRLVLNRQTINHENTTKTLIDELFRIVEDREEVRLPGIVSSPDAVMTGTGGSLLPKDNREYARYMGALQQACFNRGNAAELLGISRVTLWRRMKSLGIRI